MPEKFNLPPLPPSDDALEDLGSVLIENQGRSLGKDADRWKHMLVETDAADDAHVKNTVPDVPAQTPPKEKTENEKLADSISRLVESGFIEQVKEHKLYPGLIHIPEIQTKALSLFDDFCKENKISGAFALMDVFELPAEKCTKGVAQVVTNVFERNQQAREIVEVQQREGYHDRFGYDSDSDDQGTSRRNVPLPDLTLEERFMISKLPKNILESKEVQDSAKHAFIENIPHLMANDNQRPLNIQRADDLITTFDLRKDFIVSKETLDAVSGVFAGMNSRDRNRLYECTASSIVPYERYFASEEFYSLPEARKLISGIVFYGEHRTKSDKKSPMRKSLVELEERFKLSDEEFEIEAKRNFKEGMKFLFNRYHSTNSDQAYSAFKYLGLSKEDVEKEVHTHIPEIQESFKNTNELAYRGDYLCSLQKELKKFGITDVCANPEIQMIAQKALVKTLEYYRNQQAGSYDRRAPFQWAAKLAPHFKGILKPIEGAPLLAYFKKEIEELTNPENPNFFFADDTIINFQEFFPDLIEERNGYLKKLIVEFIKKEAASQHYYEDDAGISVKVALKDFHLPKSFLFSPEIQTAAKDAMAACFEKAMSSRNKEHERQTAFKKFSSFHKNNYVSQKDIEGLVVSLITKGVGDGKKYYADELESLKKEVSLSKESLMAIGDVLYMQALGNGEENLAYQIIENFGVSESLLKETRSENKEKESLLTAIKAVRLGAQMDKIDTIITSSVSKPNPATLPEVVAAASERWKLLITEGSWEAALKLVSFIPLSADVDREAKRGLVKDRFIAEVQEGTTNVAIGVYNQYKLDFTARQIADQVPSARKFVEIIETKFPGLYKKYFSSIENFLLALPALRNERLGIELEKHPFLGKALENNEQYGFKLLNKFGSLDKLSKANITELYENKEKILKELPQIDPNSRDFRLAMQTRLEAYRRNEEIVSSLNKLGVDAEAWLNFEDESYFELGKGAARVTEQIDGAVTRISESIEKYILEHKEVIGEFEKELSGLRVPTVNISELQSKLETMKGNLARIQSGGDAKEIAGIEKGIAALEAQISKPKTVPAWSRFVGDIGRFTVLKKDILESYTILKEEEEKMKNVETSGSGAREKRKEIQRIKSELEKQKSNIYKKTGKLTSQMKDFVVELNDMLSQTVGPERASAIAQEIGERVAEPLDHYVTDREVLEGVLGKKEDDKLDGSTLRISVWDRNPDVDLYLGNYTNCCIRIDSAHMGEESTIADYLTDLGVQVVNIYDEKKKIPVASAWCWVGADDDDNVALVVDNIEANTEYSTKFKAQLEEKLKEYITSYAKSIRGVKKVVQGSKNNDLVIAPMEGDYYKLGGYNRASGYFLEAEDEDE